MCHHPGAQGSWAITRGWRSVVSLPDPLRTLCTADGHSNPKLILTLLSPGILLLFPKLLREISTSKIKERKSWGWNVSRDQHPAPWEKLMYYLPYNHDLVQKKSPRTEPTGLPLYLFILSTMHPPAIFQHSLHVDK